ncbi:uncharacterized protein Nmag_2422 [Natrialba magadii ATCC 43099]|uniref:Uncharacterized protein n=1 Tax=Natrialba magadii (strain ATCC 43099 / DSM 3394 / CCM 3739 / CIP 104546 / IAM 13178 / JCM 8861 / NBRC 102185 / NCIMB 2190 / MS3) TaxID=547559 RepID=D3SXN4_NATMM|nr:hypothetical protein [Natrialba magadii]ADD05983.1 uncharacterized protein Nmag_2422 [Natrialba magadii ATCC 43099]ELY30508.1 hypothetical protein C500_08302 [Natrialba magadii ATCC 43099]
MSPDQFQLGTSTRRRLITGIGAATVGSLAGCLSAGETRYTLRSRPQTGADAIELFALEPAAYAFHQRQVDDEFVESLLDELHETGSVETIEAPLVEERSNDEGEYVPSYVQEQEDSEFSRVRVDLEPVTMERWCVWMEPLEELPDDAEYVTDPSEPRDVPTEDRSALDAEILEEVTSTAVSSVVGDREHTDLPYPRRGVVFFDPLDPADSELVPEPPFQYALIEPEGHGTPDELALRLHGEKAAVETTKYSHELVPVADSTDGFDEHVRSEHVAVEFSETTLSEEMETILTESADSSSGPMEYVEEGARSDAFDEILAELGLDNTALSDGEEIGSWYRYYEYDDRYYEMRYRISDLV